MLCTMSERKKEEALVAHKFLKVFPAASNFVLLFVIKKANSRLSFSKEERVKYSLQGDAIAWKRQSLELANITQWSLVPAVW